MNERKRNLLIFAISVLLAFTVGAGWQYTKASAARDETRALQTQYDRLSDDLAEQHLEGTLAAATIAAQLGSYERGRVFASDFFTGLQTRIDSMPAADVSALRELLARRDATITALSRADPDIAGELARLFVRYRAVTGGDPGIIELAPAADSGR